MVSSERLAFLVLLAGCVPKDRPIDPDTDAAIEEVRAEEDARVSETTQDASTATDAAKPADTEKDAATPVEDASADAPRDADSAILDAAVPAVLADAATEPPKPPIFQACAASEPACKEFDFETPAAVDEYFGPFWCHPQGDCRNVTRLDLESPGSSNHVWTSKVSGSDANALGAGINVLEWKRTAYVHAEIEFDFWPVSALNDESAVWFSLQRVDPNNEGHAVFSLVSSQQGSFVIVGPVYAPVRSLQFSSPPSARTHVKVVLDRLDNERSSAAVTYGSETLRLTPLAMPLFDSSGAAAYDITLGLFDSQQQHAVGAPTATARYDNFVSRTTFLP